jgi:hypothetical protein
LVAPKLENLTGKAKEFYESIVMTIVKKCGIKNFGIHLNMFEIGQKKKLCEIVNKLMEKFTKLDAELHNGRGENVTKEQKKKIGFCWSEIFGVIFEDVAHLSAEYDKLLNDEKLAHSISEQAYKDAQNEGINWAFTKIFEQLKEMEEKSARSRDELVYKFLYLGEIHFHYKKPVKEHSNWAFQQYAANLFIRSLHFEKFGRKFIQETAEIWPIYMPGMGGIRNQLNY